MRPKDCQLCYLAANRRPGQQPVQHRGRGENGIIYLLEGPGQDEMRAGTPVVGLTGNLFHRWLSIIGEDADSGYVGNVTMCDKLGGPLKVGAIRACVTTYLVPWLQDLHHNGKIRLVVALGSPACTALTGLKVSVARGKLHHCILPGLESVYVLPTWHPSAVHRDPETYLGSWLEDLFTLKYLLKGVPNVPLVTRLVSELRPGGGAPSTLVALDTETTGLREDQVAVLGVSLSELPGDGLYFVGLPVWRRAVERATEAPRRVLWNAPYDLAVLSANGFPPGDFVPFDDGMLAARALGWSSAGLKQSALARLGLEMGDLHDLTGGKPADLHKLPPEEVAYYAATDAVATRRLWCEVLEPALDASPRARAVYEMDRDLVVPLLRAQERGIAVNTEALREAEALSARMPAFVQRRAPVRLASREEVVAHIQSLGGRLHARTDKGELSVAKEILYEWAPWMQFPDTEDDDPPEAGPLGRFCALLLRYRRWQKAHGYMVRWLIEAQQDGRVRTHYKLTRARTGRLASSSPLNAQNIPPSLREVFVGPFLEADYSQIEIRVGAQMSQDSALIEAYLAGSDMHHLTVAAAAARGVTISRKTAKIINFCYLYGGSAKTASEQTGVPLPVVEVIEAGLHEAMPALFAYRYKIGKQLLDCGWAETDGGRRGYFLGFRSWREEAKLKGLRDAVSLCIQGTAAESMKRAILAIDGSRWRDRWVLTVHDSLMFEVAPHEMEEAINEIRPLMEGVQPGWQVPLKVEFKYGPTWGSLKEVS